MELPTSSAIDLLWLSYLSLNPTGLLCPLALSLVIQEINSMTTTTQYVAPQSSVYQEWDQNETEAFVPTDRQATIIRAVQLALDAKLFYTDEVRAHCAATLGVTPEQAAVGAARTEGGTFGLDVYYARQYLSAQTKFQAERVALLRLKPTEGLELGTLMFNDFKRNTGMRVTGVSSDSKEITLIGKRGAYTVTLVCTAKQIENAIDRAHERGLRKQNFSQAFPANS